MNIKLYFNYISIKKISKVEKESYNRKNWKYTGLLPPSLSLTMGKIRLLICITRGLE